MKPCVPQAKLRSLPDDDATAMEIVLDIIHGRVKQVPKEFTLDTLTAISLLIDKYQMHEVMELYVEIWMIRLKPSIPWCFSQDLYKWLSIAWVFNLAAEFKQLTLVAVRESCGINSIMQPAPDPSLPIPEVILGKKYPLRTHILADVFWKMQSKSKGGNLSAILCLSSQYSRTN